MSDLQDMKDILKGSVPFSSVEGIEVEDAIAGAKKLGRSLDIPVYVAEGDEVSFDIKNSKAKDIKKVIDYLIELGIIVRKKPGSNYLKELTDIVTKGKAMKIDGFIVDLYSASALLQIYKGVKPENLSKLTSLSITLQVEVALKVLSSMNQGE